VNRLQKYAAVLESLARANKLRESAAELNASQDFIESHRKKLVQEYPDQWIAVYKQKIIGVNKELRTLVYKIRTSDVPLAHVALEHLRSEEMPIAL